MKGHKKKWLPILVDEDVESSNLKSSQQVKLGNNEQSIDKLPILPVLLEMENEEELEPKDDALRIAEFTDERDSMQGIGITTHEEASTNDSSSKADDRVRHTVMENTTAQGEQDSASTDNQVSTERRYLTRECKAPTLFTINALGMTHDRDEPTTRSAPRGNDAKNGMKP